MKYILAIFIAITVFMTTACSEHKINNSPMFRDGTHCQCDSIVSEFPAYPDTMAVYEYPYKNGVKNGISKAYDNTRKLYTEAEMKNGVFDGIRKSYNTIAGYYLEQIQVFVNGTETMQITLYPNGTIKYIFPTNFMVNANGSVIDFDSLGFMSGCSEWKNNRRIGRCK